MPQFVMERMETAGELNVDKGMLWRMIKLVGIRGGLGDWGIE